MQFVDTHCHLDLAQFDQDRSDMIARAVAAGVTRMIVPAIDLSNCRRVLALAEQFDSVYAAVGVHPNSTAGWQATDVELLRRLAEHPKVVAIGEIGLDYYHDRAPIERQQQAFAAQLQLAEQLNLPVIIHNRESSEDVVALIRASPLAGVANAGVLHSFSADLDIARAVLDIGFYIGITGPVTFKKADSLRAIVAEIPDDRLLLETDAPYLAPSPNRGRRNEPAYVPHIADRIAAVRQTTVARIAELTTANAERLFKL